MKAKKSKVNPIEGFGVKGYTIEFSLLDLFKFNQLACELNALNQEQFDGNKQTSLAVASNLLRTLFEVTVGHYGDADWDFLNEECE